MTEAEAVRIAKVFIKYDRDGNGRLDPGELRALTRDLGQELSEAEVAVAMKYLDEDDNGTIEFNELVAWVTGVRAVPQGSTWEDVPTPPSFALPGTQGEEHF